jgi:hypothetical protein
MLNILFGMVAGAGAAFGYWFVHKALKDWEIAVGMGLLAASATLLVVVARLRLSRRGAKARRRDEDPPG